MKPSILTEENFGTGFQHFQNLMRFRIRDVLLVSSLYDSYLFEEDGRLYELIRNEYQGLNLSHSPELTRVSNGAEAIELAKKEQRFDLIITTLHIEDMHPLQFAKQVRASGLNIPIVLLAFDNRELAELLAHHDVSVFDRVFIWQGDYHLMIAIINYLEDKKNVEHDTRVGGVQSIILIEDSIRFYSSFLPLIYTEILKQSQRLISEGMNLSHRFLRMRVRPKILLCTNYEEAWKCFEQYQDHVLGIISDVDFQRNGKPDPQAGIEFAKNVKQRLSDIPILLQSHEAANRERAHAIGASFVLKDSPVLLQEVREFMNQYFSFGDFIFRTSSGVEVGRASDLKTLEEQLHIVPEESLRYHGERNHFSNWLKARTEFWLAHQLRPRKVSDYRSTEELRNDLIASLHIYRQSQHRGLITDFQKESFDPSTSFARIGGGSLGGKARGLGFLNTLINNYKIRDSFEEMEIFVPPGVVVGTEVFDQFMEENDLRAFAIHGDDDIQLTKKFLQAKKFPKKPLTRLAEYLDIVREPLAVRSSSLLEDSQYQPFAGVYQTYMLPNNHANASARLRHLVDTIKRVYASTYYKSAKDYIRMTSYRTEEEKMAVIIQKTIGAHYGDRFYPNFSGVAKSYNFYPSPPEISTDGIVSVALGLGKMVVEGGASVKFCPKYPNHLQQFYTIVDTLENNQHEFYALDMDDEGSEEVQPYDTRTKLFKLPDAETDGTLVYVGSTYSKENDAVYEGISRSGMRLVTFAPILKNKLLPLSDILQMLLEKGSWGMGTAIEIEFAVNLSVSHGKRREFGVLQMRPLVVNREFEELSLDLINTEKIICSSMHVLGNGIIDDIRDIVVVDVNRFDRSKSRTVAQEIEKYNAKLVSENRPYLLISVGRLGSLDPWLGIPVKWDQISGAKAIVETGFKDLAVTPSQGSHFFQNLTAFMVGYFTINTPRDEGMIDWDWLMSRQSSDEQMYTRRLSFRNPVIVKMNGHRQQGIILKPEE